MMTLKFEPARPDDIDEIMRIEDESFEPEIRESRSVFLDRLETFPAGNFVLVRDHAAHDTEDRKGQVPRALAGCFSSEIWTIVPPPVAAEWTLGHSARERHAPEGTVLYVSSFAVEPASRRTAIKNGTGRGQGGFLFNSSIDEIISRHPAIRTIAFIVCEDWTAARHIYEKAGFAYTGQIEGFFPSGGKAAAGSSAVAGCLAAALIMQKDI